MRGKGLALVMSAVSFIFFTSQKIGLFKVNPSPLPDDNHQHQPSVKLLPSAFKLLPEDRYLANFSYIGIRMFQPSPCTCEPQEGLFFKKLQDVFTPGEIESVKQRRNYEFDRYKKRYKSIPGDVLVAKPNSPLSYPMYGVEVLPLSTIRLPGLGVHVQNGELFEVTLAASQGTFSTLADVPDSVFHGRGTKNVTITSSSVEMVNFILQHITYTSTVYHIHKMDTVTYVMGPHVAQFPVVIRQPNLPWLYDPGKERSINSLVTIAIKTFLRYDNLHVLMRSIDKYYPNITIIIADDNDVYEKIQKPNVEQYFMPFGKGWFAGRNLAVSQVTTKYFLWLDDDYVFTEHTKIEKLVNVLENTDLDVVGGSVDGNHYRFRLLYVEGDEDGDCMHMRFGSYGPIDGFPNCALTGGVVNFFLAHTVRVQRVGFDPKLDRVAHQEMFIDGLGALLVGSCQDVVISHQAQDNPVEPLLVEKKKRYYAFRHNNDMTFKLKLQFFKNRLKCYTER